VRRFVVLFIAVVAFVLAPWPATAAPPDNFPARINLPNGFFPEGIENGRGTSVFVGSIATGAIWRGDVRTGSGAVFADGAQGGASIGIAYEASRNRLWVAGGGPSIAGAGDVRVYDASSGELLRIFKIPAPADPTVRFLNDLTVTRDAVYVTDSFNPQLVVIPLPANGSLPGVNDATLLGVTGDFHQTDGANLNGIVAKNGALVVAQSSTGNLFRVDPATGTADQVDLGDPPPLISPDGLELHGHLLYVVRNTNVVTVVRLESQLTSGEVLGDITGELDTPSTGTVAAGRLWVVNPRFNTPPTPTTEYWIAQLPLRPENG
jgi:outer membrane protein assembly factor BamB